MNLREVIKSESTLREILKNLDEHSKQVCIERINEYPEFKFFAQDTNINRVHGFLNTENLEYVEDEGDWNYTYGRNDHVFLFNFNDLAIDHSTTILTREEVLGILKEEQPMQFNETKEDKFINTEIIEINGKRYRQVAIDCRLEAGDLFLAFKEIFKYVGLDGDSVIAKNSKFKYVDTGIALGEIKFKLEEVKTKIWHYAIYEDDSKYPPKPIASIMREDLQSLKELLKHKHDKFLQWCTFEQEV